MFVRHVFRGTLEGHISPQRGPTEVITRIGVLLKILVNVFFCVELMLGLQLHKHLIASSF